MLLAARPAGPVEATRRRRLSSWAAGVIAVTCVPVVRPDISARGAKVIGMSDRTRTPGPHRPELGLIAVFAFALAILCLVSFVVFGVW